MQNHWMLALALASVGACATEQSCWQDEPVEIAMDESTPIGTPTDLRDLMLGDQTLPGSRWDGESGDVTVTISSRDGAAVAIEAGRSVSRGFMSEQSLLMCEQSRIEVPVEVRVETWFDTSFRLAGVVKAYEYFEEAGEDVEPRTEVWAGELLELEGAENLPDVDDIDDLRAYVLEDWGRITASAEKSDGSVLLTAIGED